MAKITKEDVVYISRLAKIKLKEEEIGRYQKDLEKILLYMEKLKALPTEKIKGTTHVLPLVNRLREDIAAKGLERADALSNAPAEKNGCFQVPKVI